MSTHKLNQHEMPPGKERIAALLADIVYSRRRAVEQIERINKTTPLQLGAEEAYGEAIDAYLWYSYFAAVTEEKLGLYLAELRSDGDPSKQRLAADAAALIKQVR